jgi:hypothetical protein
VQEQLRSNQCENRATGEEGEANHRCHKHSPQNRKNGNTPVRLFRTNTLKEGAMWHIDPLRGSDHEICDCTAVVARQRSSNNKGILFSAKSTKQKLNNKEMVFYMVCAKML